MTMNTVKYVKEAYDAVIIGAGPCGCVAAGTLAENGLKVLVLEKCVLPRYKSCSGVLIEKSMRFIEQKFSCGVPSSVTCTPVDNRGMVFTDDLGREYRFEGSGLNIWRDKFDYWLLSLAHDKGAEIKDNCNVTSICDRGETVVVQVGGEEIQAKYAIDCSGAGGIGMKDIGKVTTFQTYNNGVIGLDAHYFYAYLQPELSGYDAWFNVKDETLVLGVASENAHDIKNYYSKFIAYMRENHGLSISEQLREDKWIIRNIKPPFNIDYGDGGVLYAGERAGFLNPMGEGISCAMESGYCAAMAILSNYNDRRSVIDDYKSRVAETKDYMLRQWRLVGRMSNKFAFMRR